MGELRLHVNSGQEVSFDWNHDGSVHVRTWDAEGNPVRDDTVPADHRDAKGAVAYRASLMELAKTIVREGVPVEQGEEAAATPLTRAEFMRDLRKINKEARKRAAAQASR